MSIFNIKSSTLNRLANVCSFFENSVLEETKAKINTVRLENKDGHCFAIVTNVKIGVVEYLGKTEEPDSASHLILSDGLLEQTLIELSSDHIMTLTTIPELGMSVLQSSSGYSVPNCCYLWDETPLNNWREWGVKSANANSGIMFWNLNYIETLIKSSPSNNIVFPEFIDVEVPVVLRDYHDPNWVGVFFAQPPGEGVKTLTPSELPNWWSET